MSLYLYNSPEYLIAQHGAFKTRAVPVNVNYRYLDDELAYLIDNSDSEVLVFHTSLGDRVALAVNRLPRLRLLVEVDDGGEHVDGAVGMDEWTNFRLDGQALSALSGRAGPAPTHGNAH